MVEMEEQCSAADILTALLFTSHQLYTVEHPDRRPHRGGAPPTERVARRLRRHHQ